MSANDEGYRIALAEARSSLAEGGIPVGSAIVSASGKLLGRGRNMRIQNGSPILHVCSPYPHQTPSSISQLLVLR